MAIICYAGLPGAGKSYSVIENIVLRALSARRHVVHNLVLKIPALQVAADPQDGKPFDVTAYLHELPDKATAAQVVELARPGAVIVLDEVWQYWPAGIKANEVPPAELEFFKKHRHRVCPETGHASEICIIDQDPQTGVPAFLRSLIDLTYIHRKLDKVGAKGKFKVDVYSQAQSVLKPSKSALVRSLIGTYKPQVWNCYVSHTGNTKGDGPGLEQAPDARANVWKSWPVRAAVLAALAVPFLIYLSVRNFYGMAEAGGAKAPAKRQASSSELAPPAPQPTPAVAPAAPLPPGVTLIRDTPAEPPPPAPPPPLDPAEAVKRDTAAALLELRPSATWRLLGVAIPPNGEGIAFLSSATGQRRLPASQCEPYERDYRCRVEDGWSYPFSGGPASPFTAAAPAGYYKPNDQPKAAAPGPT